MDSTFTAVTVVNTTTETNLLSYSLASPVTNNLYRVTAYGTILNNSGANVTYHFRGKIGATTVMSFPTGQFSFATGANRRKWRYQFDIFFESTTAQETSAALAISQVNAVSMPRIETNGTYVGYSACTEDFATAKNVIISIEMGTANANAECVLEGYYIEKVGP